MTRFWLNWFIRNICAIFGHQHSSSKTSHKIASSVIIGSVLVRESFTETISLAVVPSGKNLGLYTASLSNFSWRSLKGLSASSKASDCFFFFEIPAFSKQLTTVLVVTFAQATSSICIASSIDNSGSGFFFCIASINYLIDIVF